MHHRYKLLDTPLPVKQLQSSLIEPCMDRATHTAMLKMGHRQEFILSFVLYGHRVSMQSLPGPRHYICDLGPCMRAL